MATIAHLAQRTALRRPKLSLPSQWQSFPRMETMRVIFAGTPEFARVALERLLQAGFEVPLVLTQPDRPAGRGMKLQASPVKRCALEHGIRVEQPLSLRLDGKYPRMPLRHARRCWMRVPM